MILLGFILLALAVAAVAVLVAQNSSDVVSVHALGNTWSVHIYWVLVAGLAVAVVAMVGLMMMNAGSAHARRLRLERRSLSRERKTLSAENTRLTEELQAERQQVNTAAPVEYRAAPVAYNSVPDTSVPVNNVVETDAPVAYEQPKRRFGRHTFHRAA